MAEFLAVVGIFFSLGALILPIYLLVRVFELAKRIKRLEWELQNSQSASQADRSNIANAQAQSSIPKIPSQHQANTQSTVSTKPALPESARAEQTEKPQTQAIQPNSMTTNVSTQGSDSQISNQELLERKPASDNKTSIWLEIEKRLSENWTGILGSIILVIGVGFLGIYAALMIGPIFRFLMVFGFGVALLIISLLMGSKAHWQKLSLWIRSASGAVILFACVGGAMLPGMRWIENENLALLLILAGVLFNMALAWLAARQSFASLHTILSLVALLILPADPLVFATIGCVSFFATLMAWRAKWEFHLLQTVTSFFGALCIYAWHMHQDAGSIDETMRWTGIAATALVSAAALMLHYRRPYANRAFERWPFISHIVSWAVAAGGFALFATGSRYNTIVLFIVAGAVFTMARRARQLEIAWLHRSDTLMALMIALLAAITLGRWDWDSLQIHLLVAMLLLAFSIAANEERENLLRVIGVLLLHLNWLVFSIKALVLYDSEKLIYQTTMIGSMLLLSLVAQAYDSFSRRNSFAFDNPFGSRHKNSDRLDRFSPAGFFSGLLAALLCYTLHDVAHVFLLVTGIAILLLLLRHLFRWAGLLAGFVPLLLGLHILLFYQVYENSLQSWQQLWLDAPLLVFFGLALFLSIWRSSINIARLQSIVAAIFLALHVIVLIQNIASTYSDLLPGVVYLLTSLAVLELYYFCSLKVNGKQTQLFQGLILAKGFWQLLAFTLVLLFLAHHFLIHLQSEILIGSVRVRLLIQIFALPVFAYWALAGRGRSKQGRMLPFIQPLFWELILLFISMAATLELASAWLPVVWITMAIGLRLSAQYLPVVDRFRVYAMLYFWASAFHTAFISSTSTSPSAFWGDQDWLAGLVAIGLQLLYLILNYSSTTKELVADNWLSQRLQGLDHLFSRRLNLLIFYPFYFAVALFLFWSFDSSLLTLLWMAEVFVIFIVGLWLSEEHFRYTALLAMLLCLARLILWDLSQSSTLMRALVFLGVGAIMILMNTIYTRFKARESEQEKTAKNNSTDSAPQ